MIPTEDTVVPAIYAAVRELNKLLEAAHNANLRVELSIEEGFRALYAGFEGPAPQLHVDILRRL